ncbi:Tricarboxylate transport sensor protein TctE [Cronobacter dublinensis 582]|nr:Tricarboxylate transport sensor protein TctE [Cronobacter dublinensis 582]
MFRRLDNAGMHPGAGLGLALVNDIARWHRTRVELLNGDRLGGLLVRVRLPLHRSPPAQSGV